ncbi:hypothetical protein [Pimelobacter simplex]|uniref:hypothetical protein n=1 Tax=Nocardioides simplex TaxID=2045 RepID=UPI003AAD00C7
MKIPRRIGTLLAGTVAALTATLSLTAPAAHATGYTPTGGPGINLVGSGITFTDIEAAQTISCPTNNLSGTVINPGVTRTYGSPAASLTTMTSSGCMSGMGPGTLTQVGTWNLAFTGGPTGAVWPARISNVTINFTSGCSFPMGGYIDGTFNQSTQRFTPAAGASGLTITGTPTSNLGVPNGGLCATFDFQLGDTIGVGGYWTNTPPAGSTPLTATAGFGATGTTVAFVGTNVSLHDIPANQLITTCPTFTMSGSVVNPGTPRAYGSPAVSLPTNATSGCSGPATLTPSGSWNLAVTAAPDATGLVWPTRLTNVTLAYARTGWCSFTITGSVNGSFNETTQRFTPGSGASGLTISSTPTGAMCASLGFSSGQTISVGGYWTNTGPALGLA